MKFSTPLKSRANAAKVLAAVLEDKKSLREALMKQEVKHDPFVQELCYGVLRFYFQLDFFLLKLTKRSIKDIEIKALLLLGLYQLFFLEKADYAAVSETVNATRDLKKTWATSFVNAVLRNALRSRDALQQQSSETLSSRFSHPHWMIEKIKKSYPENWQKILEANNQRPPMTLRLHTRKSSRQDYIAALKTKEIDAFETEMSPYGIQLKTPLPIEKVDGFAEGMISVQDEAAQFAAPLLELSPGQKVLDACAAPGGKTTHMLELEPRLQQVIAVDHDETRLQMVRENLNRLGLKAELLCDDIKNVHLKMNEAYFDRILLDVPCSATGVIRRHPDIKLLRENQDILQLAEEQYQILKSTWPLLKPGGILLYVTCSILPEENANVLERFLQETPDAQESVIEVSWGSAMKVGRQILPGESNRDGFYFARVRKV